jgi:precorrin-6y C5,15-methyltransferase (decarboxylating), CbiE subunit/precorrin-6Y C5,15-methyltransferase (decarboxylating), CbiT subunit
MKKKLYIIGAGTGNGDFLTQRALQLVKSCELLYTTVHRLLPQLSDIRDDISACSVSEIPGIIGAAEDKTIGLLVSGDTGFFSVTGSLQQKLGSITDIEIICGISSLQYFCSKAGISYEDLKTVSLHGREKNIAGAVSYNPRVFVLTGGENKVHTVCKKLMESGLGNIIATVGENLSMSNERLVCGNVEKLSHMFFDDLAVMLLENPDYVNCHLPLCDGDFVRGKVPMTKEEVRAVTLAKLSIQPKDTVYDIGAGTGAVSVEMARKAFDGSVYAIERNVEAIELIKQNRTKFGAYNIKIIEGTAPAALKALPRPDRAFIGGSGGNMNEIVELLLSENPDIRMTANAVTIESLTEAINVFEKNGLETDVVCLNVSVAKKIGSYHMMNANNPVYIITGKPGGDRGKDMT